MEENKRNVTNKISYLLKSFIKEYIIGTSIYLNSLFILKINNQYQPINMCFWLIIMFYVFERFVLADKTKDDVFGKNTILINYFIRIFFIVMCAISLGLGVKA